MAEASTANLGSGCEEKRHEGSSSESVPPGTTISRVKLLDTMVDTFLQKLVAAGSSPLLHWDGSAGPRLPSGGQSVKQAFSWAACRLPQGRKEEISDIKEEGNLEAVLNALDKIVEEGKVRKEPACNGTPCGAMCRNRRPRTSSWQMPSWQGGGRWRSCSYRSRPGSRPGRLYTENRGSWLLC
ncbi:polyamine-modulated factor 1 isoform X5 [Pan paniscus]|uniref:polyamine-modulated factor 1 isoform X6 n=1 Tax=Pan troglodytes TaxID=9598 RepID=UPI0023F28477|nr:polyamine-modulated factor 1 isoform X6 [Pan troglodytes]XP_054969167.1 polyamine-modulated factor 1 isoform X5 [Pan paniscus]